MVFPISVTERAMVVAVIVLIASELTVFTEGSVVKIIAIAIKAIFSEIFVVCDCVFLTEFFGFCPSFGFDFEELDIRAVICFADEIVAEFVEQEELCLEV